MDANLIELAGVVLTSTLASNGIITLAVKRRWKKDDAKDEVKKQIAELVKTIEAQKGIDHKIAEQIEDIQRYNVEAAKEREIVKETLRLLSYDMLSNKLMFHISRGYATKPERDSLSLYIKNYKLNHWNGDMNALLERFNALPFEEEERE